MGLFAEFPWTVLVPGYALLALAMFIGWLRQRRGGPVGSVDVLWTLGVGALGMALAFAGEGLAARRWILAALLAAWSLRLGLHLILRLRAEGEDGRYRDWKQQLGPRSASVFFVFFQAQALLAAVLALAFVPAAGNLAPLGSTDFAAIALFALAWIGEHRADAQLAAFRADPANKGKVCEAGLWRYSRHPNYFFETLHWFAYPLLAWSAPGGAWVWLAPIAMLLLVRFVTGVPPTEIRSLRSRGEAYRAYQRSTNALIPGPRRTSTT